MDLQIYNRSRERVAILENAFAVSYELNLNALWTASFSLPAHDPKNAYCLPLYYVEIYDGDERIDLFRIVGEDLTRSDEVARVYTCEHVLATLLNDVLFQYHQIGGLGVPTVNVLNYILNRQTTTNWQLSACAFTRYFEYSFENENLLSSLFAVPKAFDTDYVWGWDTTVYPWRLSLNAMTSNMVSEIRYGKNLTGIVKTQDFTGLANRIYALGYGEGVNQLTIKSVNGGVAYVQNAASIAAYGLCSTILIDARFENADTLKSYAEQILAVSKDPYVSYEISAIDLHRLIGAGHSRFRPGEIVRVVDTEDGITVKARICTVRKGDVDGDPGNITVTIANKSQDISGSISDLQNRARINETYAQGATNLAFVPFADNADAAHPAKFRFYIPTETARINKVQLNLSFEPFRSYSTAAASGGGSERTTSTRSKTTESTSSDRISVNTGDALNWESGSNGHDHGIPDGVILATTDYSATTVTGYRTWVKSGQHYHEFELDGHSHDVDIPSHNHTVSIDSHTHGLVFGIYEGSSAWSATVQVDGSTVSGITDYSDIDIVSYLNTDSSGKVARNTWHEVTVTPNTMSRVVGTLFIQLFTNSRGGGDY
jgi:phage minor structural protein